jgi:hypothetical protein
MAADIEAAFAAADVDLDASRVEFIKAGRQSAFPKPHRLPNLCNGKNRRLRLNRRIGNDR